MDLRVPSPPPPRSFEEEDCGGWVCLKEEGKNGGKELGEIRLRWEWVWGGGGRKEAKSVTSHFDPELVKLFSFFLLFFFAPRDVEIDVVVELSKHNSPTRQPSGAHLLTS